MIDVQYNLTPSEPSDLARLPSRLGAHGNPFIHNPI